MNKSNEIDRKGIVVKVNELLDTYCNECLLKAHFRKEHGKRKAHRFCIEKCTVGEQLKQFGEQLK
jgi:Zinc-finger